ncbi:MAG: LacI family DNA-binding transcriptional regulator [Anaerolineales bacterium]|jgi:DNA-binding LacI/PurR family transcriptional regulator
MARNNKITIKDVAQAAGVSTQTVSRVINNRPDVSPKTRARVQKVIADMGYAPNVLARSLSRGRSNTLGVVGFGLRLYGPTSVLAGIEKKSNELGFSFILSLLDRFEMGRVDEILRDLLSHQVEGIIWAVPGISEALKDLPQKLLALSIPIVFLNKEQTDNDIVVAMDNRLGGRLATQHLLEQNYRRIGIITGPLDWWEAQQRKLGWRETLIESGIDDLDNLIVEGDWSPASGEVGLHALIAKSPDIDAVFVCNDQMSLGALKAARRMRLQVPQDLGIVGFDDIPEAGYFYPSLTTIRQNAEKLGAVAVEQMTKFIQARQINEEFISNISWVKPRLIVRKSSIPDKQ